VKVTLVRHAMPLVSAALDPASWPLSPEGRRAAGSLREGLPADAGLWLASRELKALETLQCLAPDGHRPILRDPRFDEVQRDEPFDDEFPSRRRAWVEGELDARHAGWETPWEAGVRFDEAVRSHAEQGPLLVCSHGMVMTAWLVHRGVVQPGSTAGRFWDALAFPDLVEVDVD
jgi:broad specificity phosphatase PhoE